MSEYYIAIPNDDYVVHHGVLGQKWGIHRYQNPDGSLTEAGKRRYSKKFNKGYNAYDKVKSKYYHGKATQDDVVNARMKALKNVRNAALLSDAGKHISKDYEQLYKVGKNGRDFDDEYYYVRPGASKKYKSALKQLNEDLNYQYRLVSETAVDQKTKARILNLIREASD